jgi:hypothetical protein
MAAMDDSSDYVWHFELPERESPASPGAAATEDAVTEMVRRQVAALLRCVVFTHDGEDVSVTGFRFMDQSGVEHAIPTALGSPSPVASDADRDGSRGDGD